MSTDHFKILERSIAQRKRTNMLDKKRSSEKVDYALERERQRVAQAKLIRIQKRLHERERELIKKGEEETEPKTVIRKIPWEILPPGKHPFEAIRSYFRKLEMRGVSVEIDMGRIQAIRKYGPDEIYFGVLEFKGYLVFYFKKKRIAVLDNPIWGNAIYVLKGDWQKISKMSKAEVLNQYPSTKRIIHRGDWKKRLSKALSSKDR